MISKCLAISSRSLTAPGRIFTPASHIEYIYVYGITFTYLYLENDVRWNTSVLITVNQSFIQVKYQRNFIY